MSRSSGKRDGVPGDNLADHLDMLNVDVLRQMLKRRSIPKPRPTRKAEMIAAISGRPASDFLRAL